MSPAVVCSTTIGSTGFGGGGTDSAALVGVTGAAAAADCEGEPAVASVVSAVAPALRPQPNIKQRAGSAKAAASGFMRDESMMSASLGAFTVLSRRYHPGAMEFVQHQFWQGIATGRQSDADALGPWR